MRKFESEELAELSELVSRAFCTVPEVDVDDVWREMQAKTGAMRRARVGFGGRRWLSVAAGLVLALMVSGGIYMMVTDYSVNVAEEPAAVLEPVNGGDVVRVYRHTTTFSNESVESVVRRMGEAYGVEVRFENAATAGLRIHLEVDSGLTLDGFVELINNFESIDAAVVRHDGATILEIR